MTTTETTFPDLITRGAPTYYGVKLQLVGEDGDTVMLLGHHDDRRTAAALNRWYREGDTALDGAIVSIGGSYGDLIGEIDRTWARLIAECMAVDRPSHSPECGLCREIRAEIERGGWWVQWWRAQNEPGAFPVTLWEVR